MTCAPLSDRASSRYRPCISVPPHTRWKSVEWKLFLGNLNRDIRAANSLMQSIRSAIRGLQRWIADLNEKKQILLDALEQAKEPMLSDLLVDYFNLRTSSAAIGLARQN